MLDAAARGRARRGVGRAALDTVRALAPSTACRRARATTRPPSGSPSGSRPAASAVEVERVPGDGRTRLPGPARCREAGCARARPRDLIDGERPRAAVRLRRRDAVAGAAQRAGARPLPARGASRAADGREDYDGRRRARRGACSSRGPVRRAHRLAVVERAAAGLLSTAGGSCRRCATACDDPDRARVHVVLVGGGRAARLGLRRQPAGRRSAARARCARGERSELDVEIESRAVRDRDPARLGACSRDDAARRGAGAVAPLPSAAERQRQRLGRARHASRPRACWRALGAAAALRPAARRAIRFLWMPELTGTLRVARAATRRGARASSRRSTSTWWARIRTRAAARSCSSARRASRRSFAEELLRAIRDAASRLGARRTRAGPLRR